MTKSLYKKRLIVASGECNQTTRQWKSMVCIFWKTTTQKLHTISDLAGIFRTESEAIAFALRAGKDWIDSQPAGVKDLGNREFGQFTNNKPGISDLTFRYHPVMTRTSGFQSWPPIWTTTRRERNDRPVGEIGILKQVLMNDLFNSMLFLIIEYQSVRYMGAMQFDDSKFCYEISNILKSHVGYSIKEIGDLVLSPQGETQTAPE